MKITLRKANTLQTAITGYIKTIDVKSTITLNEFQDPQSMIVDARDKFIENDRLQDALTVALYSIRRAIGNANATSGISDLLSHSAYIDKRLAQLAEITNDSVTMEDAVISGKLEKIRTRTDAASYYDRDVTTGVLTAAQLDGFKQEAQTLKKKKQSISDKILDLNFTEIELETDVVELLTTVNLI